MPTYDYECLKCSHRFEVFQNITAAKLKKCPRCGGKLKRLPGTGVGLIFKGSGFYTTDHRKPAYLEAAKKEKEKDSKTAGTEVAKAEPGPKPAAEGEEGGRSGEQKAARRTEPTRPAAKGKNPAAEEKKGDGSEN